MFNFHASVIFAPKLPCDHGHTSSFSEELGTYRAPAELPSANNLLSNPALGEAPLLGKRDVAEERRHLCGDDGMALRRPLALQKVAEHSLALLHVQVLEVKQLAGEIAALNRERISGEIACWNSSKCQKLTMAREVCSQI